MHQKGFSNIHTARLTSYAENFKCPHRWFPLLLKIVTVLIAQRISCPAGQSLHSTGSSIIKGLCGAGRRDGLGGALEMQSKGLNPNSGREKKPSCVSPSPATKTIPWINNRRPKLKVRGSPCRAWLLIAISLKIYLCVYIIKIIINAFCSYEVGQLPCEIGSCNKHRDTRGKELLLFFHWFWI